MFFSEVHLTKASGLEVASAINHFVQNEIDNKYFLIVVLDTKNNEEEIFIRPMFGQDFIPSVDGSQMIRCMAEDGRRIDVVIPPAEIRETRRALVAIGPPPSEDN